MEIKQKNTAELLELTVDDKLTFEKRIKKPFRSAGNQLNALFRLKLSKKFFKKFYRKLCLFKLQPLSISVALLENKSITKNRKYSKTSSPQLA